LDETRHKRQVEIIEINKELEDEYKVKLQEALNQMREQLDTQLRINRKEMEEMYESKVRSFFFR
jgi:lamin B